MPNWLTKGNLNHGEEYSESEQGEPRYPSSKFEGTQSPPTQAGCVILDHAAREVIVAVKT